ncbi:MAG: nuclear transport factor 2 family protein [Gemmatimonadota bacterium]|nr:MAG: nuclear transport factor 2 family protein [Gemmatimonadota bacterium]
MIFNAEQQAREEIRQILKRINGAWMNGHPERLQDYFHDDMVISQLGIGRIGIGRQACIQSYEDFINRAVVKKITESDHTIDVWRDTAVASYTYEIDYEMNGEEHSDSGQDVFVFIRDEGNWLAVWRTLVPSK